MMRALRSAALLGLITVHLAGQTALYVRGPEKNWLLVEGAEGNAPLVMQGEKLRIYRGNDFALRKAEEYAPVFVAIRNLRVGSAALEVSGSTDPINNTFELKCDLESACDLERVFLALEITGQDGRRCLFLQGAGDLAARRPRSLWVRPPISRHLGPSRLILHVFSGDSELLHSNMPFQYRESVLDRMVAKRIQGVGNAPPQPFAGPAPEYPPALAKTGASGTAVIRMRIGRNGAVLDPVVANASRPDFGSAALSAVRLWRFLPRMQNGRPVEALAEMPFDFAPPQAAGNG